MRRTIRALWHYRPRCLTLVVFCLIVAPLVLANLSSDWEAEVGLLMHRALHGWPFVWHWHNIAGNGMLGYGIRSWDYSLGRLTGNMALWFVMLAAPTATCEWWLRRYPRQPRWSLRTMLIIVGLAAAGCGWFADGRRRAKLQDEFIEAAGACTIRVERTGPKWLDFIGADHFRRLIIGAQIDVDNGENREEFEARLRRLTALPNVEHLTLKVEQLIPEVIEAIGSMCHLRELILIESAWDDYPERRRLAKECLAAIGRLHRLERLHLQGMEIAAEDLAALADLKNLESLSLDCAFTDQPSLLVRLPALPRLESVDLQGYDVCEADLRHLAGFPRLKSLGLNRAFESDVVLEDLSSLSGSRSLEELSLEFDRVSASALKSLTAVKRLKTLHLDQSLWTFEPGSAQVEIDDGTWLHVPKNQRDRFLEAWRCLHESHAEIRIDSRADAVRWQSKLDDPFTYWLHQSDIWRVGNPDLPWLTPSDKVYPY